MVQFILHNHCLKVLALRERLKDVTIYMYMYTCTSGKCFGNYDTYNEKLYK